MTSLFKKHLYILGLFLIITLIMSWPLPVSFTDQVAGRGGDPWQTMWRFQEKENMLRNAFQTNSVTDFLHYEFFGGGEPRLINISVWPWMDIHAIFGQPVTYNLVFVISTVLSGYAMFLLARYLMRSLPASSRVKLYAAFIAGILYMFAPYRIAHSAGHFGAMQMQWLPLAVLWLILWLKKPGFSTTVLLALWLTLQAWTEHHYMLWLAIFAVAITAWQWRKIWVPTRLPYTFLLGFLLLFFVILPYWPTIRLSDENPGQLDLGAAQTIRFSANPLSYVTPSPEHPIWGNFWNRHLAHKFTGNVAEATQFLGFLPLILTLIFWRKIEGKQKYFWVAVMFIFWLISLGPRLHLPGRVTNISLLYAFLDTLPVFSAVRTVGRAGAMVLLSFAVIFALALVKSVKTYSAAALIVAVILLEFLFFPIDLQSTRISPVYDALNDMPGQTVIEVPAATDYTVSSVSLYASHKHDKEILGLVALERGMDTADLEILQSLPVVRHLLYLGVNTLEERREEFFGQDLRETFFDVAFYLNIGAIVLHEDKLTAREAAVYQDFLEEYPGFTPVRIGHALLYRLDNLSPRKGVFLARQKGWHNVTYDKEEERTLAMIKRQADISLVNILKQTKTVTLTWSVSLDTPGEISLYANEEKVSFVQTGNTYTATLTITPGTHLYTFVNAAGHDVVLQDFSMSVN